MHAVDVSLGTKCVYVCSRNLHHPIGLVHDVMNAWKTLGHMLRVIDIYIYIYAHMYACVLIGLI